MVALYDLSGNYVGEGPMPAGGATPQGTKRNRGDIPPSYNSNTEPWPGAIDQTAYKSQSGGLNTRQVQLVAVDPFTGNPIVAGNTGNRPADIIQNIPAPQVASASKSAPVDAANPINADNWGLGYSFFTEPPSDAEKAITEITVRGGNKPALGTTFMDQVAQRAGKPMVFSPIDPVGPAPAGDPWAVPSGGDLRVAPAGPQRQGTVTANRSAVADALMAREAQPNPSQVQQALYRQAHPITYDQPIVNVPGTAGEVMGIDMAFMPKSVQTSSRWRTGY